MRCRPIILVLAIMLLAPALFARVDEKEKDALRAALLTVEGTVMSIDTFSGDEGDDLVLATIAIEDPEPREMSLLLAPASVLLQAGFEIETGESIRARVFVTEQEQTPVHKVFNLSRGQEARLRTLMRMPLWDSEGRWQGGWGRHGRSDSH